MSFIFNAVEFQKPAFSSHQAYLQVRIPKPTTNKSNTYEIQVLTTSVSFWQLNQDFLLKQLLYKMLKWSSFFFQPWNHPFEKQTLKPQAFRTRSQYYRINHSHSKNCTINGPFNRGLSRQGIISHKTSACPCQLFCTSLPWEPIRLHP